MMTSGYFLCRCYFYDGGAEVVAERAARVQKDCVKFY
jgi:hypothetical protein